MADMSSTNTVYQEKSPVCNTYLSIRLAALILSETAPVCNNFISHSLKTPVCNTDPKIRLATVLYLK